jgi:hypothetical protein
MRSYGTIRSEIGDFTRIAWGNGLLIAAWLAAAAVGIFSVLVLHSDTRSNEGMFGPLGLLPELSMALVGVTGWPLGMWLIGGRARGALAGPGGNLLRWACRGTGLLHAVWVVILLLPLFSSGCMLEEAPFKACVVIANVLTLLYAWHVGALGRRLKSPLAWMAWVWGPVCLLVTWYWVKEEAYHWTTMVAYRTKGHPAWLGCLAIIGIVLPILIAHIGLQLALAKSGRQLRAGGGRIGEAAAAVSSGGGSGEGA